MSSRWFSLTPPRTLGLGLLFWGGTLVLAYQTFRAITSPDLDRTLGGTLLVVAISLIAQPRSTDADDRGAPADDAAERQGNR